VLATALVAATGARGEAAAAGDDDRGGCQRINARGVGQDLGGGNTTATIRGGILKGTTAASFAITGGTPPVLTFDGTITFTTKRGTLTLGLVGTLDVSTGRFSATGLVTAGTGIFAGATGSLRLDGVQNLATGSFTETVRGTICLAHGNDDDDD
jgi:hypothetical protein